MRIDGAWIAFNDGVSRPVILGEVLSRDGNWVRTVFLVDTGADRTVLSASAYVKLGFGESEGREQLGGLGGLTEAVFIGTQIRLTRDGGGKATFRGDYAAVTDDAALDFSVLGRDLLNMFAVIVDDPKQVVCLLTQRHSYAMVEN